MLFWKKNQKLKLKRLSKRKLKIIMKFDEFYQKFILFINI